jgi:hypothetical protein
MSNRLTQAAWGACDSDHIEQNTRPIGQKAQPATIGRECKPPGGDGGRFYDDR